MKTAKNIAIIFCLVNFIISIQYVNATNYSWLGNTSTDWATGTNWSPTGVPSTNDTVTIASYSNHQPVLDTIRTVKKFTISSVTLDLNTYSLTISNFSTFTSGTISNGKIYSNGTQAGYLGTTFNCEINSVAGKVYLSGGTFNYRCYFEDTITNASHYGAGGCTFNAAVVIKKNSGAYFGISLTTGNTFNDSATFLNVRGNNTFNVTDQGTTYFNGPVFVGANSGGDLYFFGTSVLASGKTINVDATTGFTSGDLRLSNFTQSGSTSQSFTLTGAATISCYNTTWNGAVSFTAPHVLLKMNTFNGTASFYQTHATIGANSEGGNTFNGATTISASGALLRMGTTYNDTFNCDLTVISFVNIGTATTTVITGNLTAYGSNYHFNNSGVTGTLKFTGYNSQHISSGGNGVIGFNKMKIDKAGGSVTLDSTITVDDTLTFVNGNFISTSTHYLSLLAGSTVTGASNSSFVSGPVKKTGNTAFVFPTGKNSIYRAIEMSAPSVSSNAYTAEYFDAGQSLGNTMDGSMKYIRDCGYWNLARNSGSSNVTVSLHWDTSPCALLDSATVKVANWNGSTWKDLGNGGITGNSSTGKVANSTTVITWGYFALAYNKCFLTAAAGSDQSVCSGDSVTIGGSPVAAMGMTAYTYSWSPSGGLSSTSAANPKASPSSTTNYVVSVTDLSGCTMRDTVNVSFPPQTLTWTGATSTAWETASNWSPAKVPISCDNVVMVSGSNDAVINTAGVFVNNFTINSGSLNLNENSFDITGNAFFNGGTINTGWLYVDHPDTASFNGTHIGSNVDAAANVILLNGSEFDQIAIFIQEGNSNTSSSGGNVFNYETVIQNLGNGNMYLAASSDDVFNDNVGFTMYGDGTIYPGYTKNAIFSANLYLEYHPVPSNGTVIFGANGGKAIFDGEIDQTVSYAFSGFGITTNASNSDTMAIFKKLQVNKPDGNLIMNFSTRVTDSLILTKGNIVTDTTKLLFIRAGSVVVGASDTGFVDGPVKKFGNTAFTFPIGDNGFYLPLKISAPANVTDAFTAQYLDTIHGYSSSDKESSLGSVSGGSYWKLDKNSAAGASLEITLGWDDGKSVADTGILKITRWDGTEWLDLGRKSITGDNTKGSITTQNAQTTFGIFTLAYLPMSFTACTNGTGNMIPDLNYRLNGLPTVVGGGLSLYSPSLNGITTGMYNTDAVPPASFGGTQRSVETVATTAVIKTSGTFPFVQGANSTRYFAVELFFKPGKNFTNQRTCRLWEIQATIGSEHYGAITTDGLIFNTTYLNKEDEWKIYFDGIGRKSLQYYTDGNWHHLAFVHKKNTTDNTYEKEIWIDGELYEDHFKESISANPLTGGFDEIGGLDDFANFYLSVNGLYDNYIGLRDQPAVYITNELCTKKIYDHWHNMNTQNYNFDGNTAGQAPIPGGLVGSFDENEFPINFSPNNGTTADYDYTPITSMLGQLQSYPLPRYKDGHGLRKNYDAMNTLTFSPDPAVASEIQKELAFNWNYYYNVCENVLGYLDPYNIEYRGDAKDLLGTNPEVKYAINALRAQFVFDCSSGLTTPVSDLTYPTDVMPPCVNIGGNDIAFGFIHASNGYLDQIPAVNGSSTYPITEDPIDYYLHDGTTFMSPKGAANPNYRYWKYSARKDALGTPDADNFHNIYSLDGYWCRDLIFKATEYTDGIVKHFPIDYIAENNEYSEIATDDILVDAAVQDDYNSYFGDFIDVGKNEDGSTASVQVNEWLDYQGFKKWQLDHDYTEIAFQPASGGTPISDNTICLFYAVDGYGDFDPYEAQRARYTWYRHSQKPIYNSLTNTWAHYSTPDYYPNRPFFWRNGAGAIHGWDWLMISRQAELKTYNQAPYQIYDNRFAPYVAAGWDFDERSNIRPGQWLGLMKCTALLGVDFFNVGHFKVTNPPIDSKAYTWQGVIPSYAQAVASRVETYLTDGHLLEGDVLIDPQNAAKGVGYLFDAQRTDVLVTARKLEASEKFVISGALEVFTNKNIDPVTLEPLNLEAEASIDLKDNPNGSATTYDNLQFKVRRQGSTYVFDPTQNPDVFYQIDAWHEYKHPERWSKDFRFEAEVWDNTPSGATRHTIQNTGTGYDYRDFTTYVTTTTSTILKYFFHPRHTDGKDYYFWVRAKAISGTGSLTVSVYQGTGSTLIGTKTMDCIIDDDNWLWYRFDPGTLDPIVFSNLDDKNYRIQIETPTTANVQIDQIVLTPDKFLVVGEEPDRCNSATIAANYCLSGGDVLVINSSNNTSTDIPSVTEKIIYITDDFIVDNGATYTWSDKTIIINEGIKIIVGSGEDFVLDNCSVSSGCEDMWDQIQNDGKVTITNGSLITDSENGLQNSAGSEFDLFNSVFDNNYYTVTADGNTGTSFSTSEIEGCTIKCSGGEITKDPHNHALPPYQISLKNVTNFTMGDAGTANINSIGNATTGISIDYASTFIPSSATITIKNTDLEREIVPNNSNYKAASTAINSTVSSSLSPAPTCTLTVNNQSRLRDWKYGIKTYDNSRVVVTGNSISICAFGLYTTNANVVVQNNDFQRGSPLYAYTGSYKAVYTENLATTTPTYNLTANTNNTFNDWTYGIHASRIATVTESSNYFGTNTNAIYNSNCNVIDQLSNTFFKGTNGIQNVAGKDVDVKENVFLWTSKPIKVSNSNACTQMSIFDNHVNWGYGYGFNGNPYSEEAIRIETVSGGTAYNIKGNKINNCRIGIHGRFTNALKVVKNSSNEPNEYQTYIPLDDLMDFGTGKPHYGVWMESCNDVNVFDCIIKWNTEEVLEQTHRARIRGISFVTSTGGIVKQNDITKMGAGIHIFGDCAAKKLKCNLMTDCFTGVYLDPHGTVHDANIPNQGVYSSGTSWNNNWDNVSLTDKKVAGVQAAGPKRKWMYTGTADLDDPFPFSVTNMDAVSGSLVDGTCEPPDAVVADEEEFTSSFDPVVNDTIDYPSDDEVYIYHKFENYYRIIKADTSILYDNTSTGSYYRTIYDSLKFTNIGMFEAVRDSIYNGNLAAALANLDTMDTENILEFNLWYSLRAFINYYSKDSIPGSSVIDSLYDIAYQDVFFGGLGVHVARALLHYDQEFIDEEEEERMSHEETLHSATGEKDDAILIYPNPSADQVTIMYNHTFASHEKLELFNSLNQLCAEYPLPEGASVFRFSIASLPESVYFCRITNGKSVSEKVKLVIIR